MTDYCVSRGWWNKREKAGMEDWGMAQVEMTMGREGGYEIE